MAIAKKKADRLVIFIFKNKWYNRFKRSGYTRNNYMELKKVYIGSWFPKMSLHLEEFRNFLLNGDVIDLLDKKKAVELFKKLNPRSVEFGERAGIKFAQANSGESVFRYFEDGLLVVEKQAVNLKKDLDQIIKFYKNDLSPVLSYLFSKGAKGLEIIRAPGARKPIFVSSLGAGKDDIDLFFSAQNKKVETVSGYKELSVNYAEELVLININKDSEQSEEDVQSLIENIILFNESGRHLRKLLQIHRMVWDKADAIISKSSTKIKDLPKDNEVLTNFSNTVVNILARIEQMKLNLSYRESTFGREGLERLRLKFKNRTQDLNYLSSLFEMTGTHLNNNISQLSSIYQEQQQKSLDRLQVLFLTSVVSGFLSLGFFDSFYISILLKFGGITILATLIVYYFWHSFTFKKARR